MIFFAKLYELYVYGTKLNYESTFSPIYSSVSIFKHLLVYRNVINIIRVFFLLSFSFQQSNRSNEIFFSFSFSTPNKDE